MITFLTKKNLLYVSIILFLAGFWFVSSAITHAQSFGGVAGTGVQIEFNPKHPRPGDVVTIEATGYSYDMYRSNYGWYVNGELAEEGVGKRTFSLRAGPLGSRTLVQLMINTDRGTIVQRDFEIVPAVVAITWQGNTYVPPLYKGLPQHTPSSAVTFVAVPSLHNRAGERIPAADLVYTWKQGNRVLQDVSGIGRQSIIVPNERFTRSLSLTVEVSTFDRSQVASHTVTVPTQDPRFLLYQVDPLLGVLYNQALTDEFLIQSEETSLVAEPYNFSIINRDSTLLSYEWKVDNAPIVAQSVVTLRPSEGNTGFSRLNLVGRHTTSFMQSARSDLTIRYGE